MYKYKYPRAALTVDAIVFTRENNSIFILLIQRGIEPFKNRWALPGGFVNIDETLEVACIRELSEETGLQVDKMTQFKAFDAINRDPRHRTISVAYFVELDKSKNKFKPFLSIWKHFKIFKPDIVHSWDYLSSMYAYFPLKRYKAKFINASIQDVGVEKGWKLRLKKMMLRLADIPVSNSKTGLKNYGVKGEYVYNALDLNRFYEREENKEFTIIKVASFSDYKDHQCFISAAIELTKQNIVDKVYLAGDGIHKQKYIDEVESEGKNISEKFHFLGSITNVEEYLKTCHVGVLCSTTKYGEGISNSILEYMAAGAAVVATNIGATSEIIENYKNGLLIQEASVSELIKTIKLLKKDKDLRFDLIQEAKKTVREKFNYQKNINKLEKLYKSLAKK
ncbi:MAG: glycosyltransferase [Draconibacterium sp.]|nr:glycosyltransferase [Draconibacterium sp.]